VTVYAIAELVFRRMASMARADGDTLYAGLPVLVYALVAADNILGPSLPALRVVAMFGMGFIALLAVFRLLLTKPPAAG
jgi:hypothetical protein